jgi:hypothetical protein
MGLLVNIVCADEDEIESVGYSAQPLDEWSGIEVRDVDTGKWATLHCLLTGDDFEEALAAYEPAFAADEALVLRLPDAVTEKLAAYDEEALELVGEELAATEEFELAAWPQEDVQAFLVELGNLAQLAESQGQILLVWMHPLRT